MSARVRKVLVATVARSDASLYAPVAAAIARRGIELRLLAGGAHDPARAAASLGPLAERDVAAFVSCDVQGDDGVAVSRGMGRALTHFADALAAHRPDLLLVLGDRWEMHAAASAALPLRIAVAHIHGGELTFGAYDDSLRHSITKLSHLHFVSAASHARRVAQLGEEPWRIHHVGAPGLDALRGVDVPSREAWSQAFAPGLREPFVVVTWHPVTLDPSESARGADAIIEALTRDDLGVLVTAPGRDAGAAELRARLEALGARPGNTFVENLGLEGYAGALRHAVALVGNSSSGIIEAPLYGTVAINVGSRQAGRERAANVVDVVAAADAITAALRDALTVDRRAAFLRAGSPYDRGNASERIADVVAALDGDDRLLQKRFVDLP